MHPAAALAAELTRGEFVANASFGSHKPNPVAFDPTAEIVETHLVGDSMVSVFRLTGAGRAKWEEIKTGIEIRSARTWEQQADYDYGRSL